MSITQVAKAIEALGVNKRISGIRSDLEDLIDEVGNLAPTSVSLSNAIIVSKNGNDTTGDGTFSKPYVTIQKAIDEAISNSLILIAPGTYVESPTCSKSNVVIATLGPRGISNVYVNGTFTFTNNDSLVQCHGIASDVILHSGNAPLSLNMCSIADELTTISASELEVFGLKLIGDQDAVININGGGNKSFLGGCKLGYVNVNETSARAIFRDTQSSLTITVNDGMAWIGSGFYKSTSEITSALVATGGTVILDGPTFVTPLFNPATINIDALATCQIINASFDLYSSVLDGTFTEVTPALTGSEPLYTDTSIAVSVKTIYDDWARTTANALGTLTLQNDATWQFDEPGLHRFKSFKFYIAHTDVSTDNHLTVVDVSKQSLLDLPTDTWLSLDGIMSISISEPDEFTIEYIDVTVGLEPRLLRIEGFY